MDKILFLMQVGNMSLYLIDFCLNPFLFWGEEGLKQLNCVCLISLYFLNGSLCGLFSLLVGTFKANLGLVINNVTKTIV